MDRDDSGPNLNRHEDRIDMLENGQGRLASDVLRIAEKLTMIEAILIGADPSRDGGLRAHLRLVEQKIREMTIWVKALMLVAAIWVILFGPQRLQEIVKFFK